MTKINKYANSFARNKIYSTNVVKSRRAKYTKNKLNGNFLILGLFIGTGLFSIISISLIAISGLSSNELLARAEYKKEPKVHIITDYSHQNQPTAEDLKNNKAKTSLTPLIQ